MTPQTRDPHDGWTPEVQEQVQPGDPWKDPQESAEPREAVVAALLFWAKDWDGTTPPTPEGLSNLHAIVERAALTATPLPSDTPADGLDAAIREIEVAVVSGGALDDVHAGCVRQVIEVLRAATLDHKEHE